MGNFGSSKLIFNITNINDLFYLQLDFYYDSFKFKTIFKKIIKYDKLKYQEEVENIKKTIHNIFSTLNIKNSCIINYNCSCYFERFNLPKLSKKNSLEIINSKLSNMYYDFNNKYYFGYDNKFNICFFEKDKYLFILKLINDLNIKINNILINHDNINKLLNKYHYLNDFNNQIFINILSNYIEVFIYEGFNLLGTKFIEYQEADFKVGVQNLIDYLRLILYQYKINNIYLNDESDTIINIIEEDLQIKIENLTNIKSDCLSYLNSYSIIDNYKMTNKYKYNFPFKVKCNLQ